ncbi:MAG: DinB family protein [Anditalea sp.]
MNPSCQQNLKELKFLLESINTDQYQYKSQILSGASIGQHIRHILEFYLCLIKSTQDHHIVNYDKRKRNLQIEKRPEEAIATIDQIITDLAQSRKEGDLYLQGNYSIHEIDLITIPTTFKRELAYCLDHTIHHQALIKIGLQELNLVHLVDECFGVSPATIRFNQEFSKSA